MNIISFPIDKIAFSHDINIFLNLGFEIIDTGLEGSYVKLPKGWNATYSYHTPFEFYIIIEDTNSAMRASASLLGQSAKLELFNRYRIINYKPWLSPYKSELRVIDSANNHILYVQAYIPKLIPNHISTNLLTSCKNNSDNSYKNAYQNAIDFCKRNAIDILTNDPLAYW